MPNDYKESHENRRNQQVYSASPVKTVDKSNDSGEYLLYLKISSYIYFLTYLEMYEISPYATFSVNDGRTGSSAKTPTRGGQGGQTPHDYTMQFKTFGHPEGENLNATAYPLLPNPSFGHTKNNSSWHKQRCYNTDGKLYPYIKCDPEDNPFVCR